MATYGGSSYGASSYGAGAGTTTLVLTATSGHSAAGALAVRASVLLTTTSGHSAAGALAVSAHAHDRLKLGPPDTFPLPPEPFPIVIGVTAADRFLFSDTASGQRKDPTLTVSIDLSARQQAENVTLVLATDPASTLPFSINPQTIQMWSGDTGPTLRFLVVADDTSLPADLTGATIQFLVRRINAPTLAIPSALSGCTNLPNPTQLAQTVTASGSGQSVLVDTTTPLPSGTSLMNVGIPGTATYETCNLGNADATHVFGIFTHNHVPGEPVVEAGTTSPDPVYNARGGYTLYAWPQGAPQVPATYQGQLKISFASGVIEHTAQLTITVNEGF